jgi:hypothetical protein
MSCILLANEALSSLSLLATGLLATAVFVGVYELTRHTEPSFALFALLLGLAGGIGSALHGGYDLAALLHPRGLLTFGATGIACGCLPG